MRKLYYSKGEEIFCPACGLAVARFARDFRDGDRAPNGLQDFIAIPPQKIIMGEKPKSYCCKREWRRLGPKGNLQILTAKGWV
jgi:hypothetical protein